MVGTADKAGPGSTVIWEWKCHLKPNFNALDNRFILEPTGSLSP